LRDQLTDELTENSTGSQRQIRRVSLASPLGRAGTWT
jgi:hypothetical protein